MMTEDIICAGFGGQGIMLLGKFIAFGAMKKGLNTTWMPSYGAEVRGGTAYSMVVISDDDIASPLITSYDTAIVMNQPSLDKFLPNIKPKGLLILNSSIIEGDIKRKDITILKVAMTEIARKLGNVKTANMIALGAYIKAKDIFSKKEVLEGIDIAFKGKKELIDLNIKALEEGLKTK